MKSLFLTFLLICLSSNVMAGSFYSSPSRGSSLATSVLIDDKGIFNLVISVNFLNEPFDKAPYTSDSYEEMIKRLNIEWHNVVLNQVLASNSYKTSDLPVLKKSIDSGLSQLVASTKKKYGIKDNVEVVYSVGNFYLVNINNE